MPGHSRESTRGRLDPRGSLDPPQARKQGWLEKQASRKIGVGRNLQRRYCEVYRGFFEYSKTSGPDRKPRATIALNSWCTVVQDLTKGRIFFLTPNPATRTYQFVAETETECKEWVDAIRAGCVDEGPSHGLSQAGEPFFKEDGPTIGVFVKAFLRCEEHQCVVVTTTLFPRSPVRDLMRIIRDTPSLAFPMPEQNLMYDRAVLEPQHTLEHYGIKADAVIVVIHNTPIIRESTSVSEILAHLESRKLELPDPAVGCVAWSDRKQEHYHIYWARGEWASRAQPTLSAEQKKEIRASGSTRIVASREGPVSPSGSRTYLATNKDNPVTLSASFSRGSPLSSSISRAPPPPLAQLPPGGTNPSTVGTAVIHAPAFPVSNNNNSGNSGSESGKTNPSPILNKNLGFATSFSGVFPPKPRPEPRKSHPSQEMRPRVSSSTLPMPPQEGITWKRGKILGKGAWGTVYEALNIQSGALMAVKQVPIKLDDAEKQSQAQALEREIAMMTVLSHPNIVKIIGSEIKDDKINILMEYVPGASLSTQLKQFGPFSEEHARKYARQLVEALAYCHAAGVVHRDIKGANVLVTLSGNPKLADFGSAKRLADVEQKESLSEDFNYTTEWTAPEVFSQGEFNSKVDIWSLGCVIIEMTTAQTPWAEQKFASRERAMFFIGSTATTPVIPQKLSAEGQDFVLRCLQRDPLARASAKELLDHPWISTVTIDRQFETQSLEPGAMANYSTANLPKPYAPPPEVSVASLTSPDSEMDLSNSNPQTP